MKITFMLASTCLILGLVPSITARANAINNDLTALPDSETASPTAKKITTEPNSGKVSSHREPTARAPKQAPNRLTEAPIGERRQSFFVLLQILRSAK
ncbi:MAG: hypothetical protein CVU16_14975 [Betaproteobacteria bacterium HGW-Betaproteobacteria-10]|nr:MAG: hypothetical protein CVU16_14975 [Betaproteobacteria bacterium HGW-Betaproteobacteria-10]